MTKQKIRNALKTLYCCASFIFSADGVLAFFFIMAVFTYGFMCVLLWHIGHGLGQFFSIVLVYLAIVALRDIAPEVIPKIIQILKHKEETKEPKKCCCNHRLYYLVSNC